MKSVYAVHVCDDSHSRRRNNVILYSHVPNVFCLKSGHRCIVPLSNLYIHFSTRVAAMDFRRGKKLKLRVQLGSE